MKRLIAIALLSLSLTSCAPPEVEVGLLTTPPYTQIPTQAILNSDNETAIIATIINSQESTQYDEQMDKEEIVLQRTVEFICPSSDEPLE